MRIGVADDAVKLQAQRGLRFVIGQMYGVVCPGLIHTLHVFQGLKRDMFVRDDRQAALTKLALTWPARRDATFVGDPFDGRLEYMDAPEGKVFAVYVSPNMMLEAFPSIFGWAEHWTWIAAAPDLAGAPIGWSTRYDSKVWSR